MPSARIRVNSHLRPYKTSPSPAIRDTSAPAIQDISAPAIRGSSPAETCICNSVLNCAILLKSLNLFKGATYVSYTIKFGNPDEDQLSGDQSVEWNMAKCEVAGVRICVGVYR